MDHWYGQENSRQPTLPNHHYKGHHKAPSGSSTEDGRTRRDRTRLVRMATSRTSTKYNSVARGRERVWNWSGTRVFISVGDRGSAQDIDSFTARADDIATERSYHRLQAAIETRALVIGNTYTHSVGIVTPLKIRHIHYGIRYVVLVQIS